MLLLTACAQEPQTVSVSDARTERPQDQAILEDPDGKDRFVAIVDGRYTARMLIPFWYHLNKDHQAVEPGKHSVVIHDDVRCSSRYSSGTILDLVELIAAGICESGREPKCISFDITAEAGRIYRYATDGPRFFLIDSETSAKVVQGHVTYVEKEFNENSARCRGALPPLNAVQDVDIDRYMGRWNIIAYAPSAYARAPVSYNADLTAFMGGDNSTCETGVVEYAMDGTDDTGSSFLTRSICSDDNENRNNRGERWCVGSNKKLGVFRSPILTTLFESKYVCPSNSDQDSFRPDTYWIVALDENYQWSLVSNPFRKDTRILSREPRLSDRDLLHIVNVLEQQHHDPCWLIVSSKEQVEGQPRLCDYTKQISQVPN